MKTIFENIKFLWGEISITMRIVAAGFIIAMVVAMLAGAHDDEKRTIRTNFCLERGYDGFKHGMQNDGDKFYCWNTVNGEIQKFRDPIR